MSEAKEVESNESFDPFGKYDDRPQKGWWAPGNYTNKCHKCGCRFTGDKRAGECADCAYDNPTIDFQI